MTIKSTDAIVRRVVEAILNGTAIEVPESCAKIACNCPHDVRPLLPGRESLPAPSRGSICEGIRMVVNGWLLIAYPCSECERVYVSSERKFVGYPKP